MHCPPDELEELLDEYYAFRGWDEAGAPLEERLDDLDLAELT